MLMFLTSVSVRPGVVPLFVRNFNSLSWASVLARIFPFVLLAVFISFGLWLVESQMSGQCPFRIHLLEVLT